MKTLVLIGCVVPGLLCSAKPFKTSEEKIPAEVKRATAKQIEHYLGSGNDFKGVALLDERIDWNDRKNWPKEFSFRGKNYVLTTYPSETGEDQQKQVIARRQSVTLSYGMKGSGARDIDFTPQARWSSDGTMRLKWLNTPDLVFSYEFYPTGELLGFGRVDAATKTELTDYFDKTGRKRGTVKESRIVKEGIDPVPQCEWDGETVDHFTCIKNKDAMYYATFVKPFKTADEKIRQSVREIVAKQIETCLGKEDFRGLPLLDQTIEWNDFNNWPDEFTFRGETYRLRLTHDMGDTFADLSSRRSAGLGVDFLASYLRKGERIEDGPPSGLWPSASWTKDGTLREKDLSFKRNHVFGFTFYRGGELFLFSREDCDTKAYFVDYFDKQGTRRGGIVPMTPDNPEGHVWDGEVVSFETFQAEQLKLLREGSARSRSE